MSPVTIDRGQRGHEDGEKTSGFCFFFIPFPAYISLIEKLFLMSRIFCVRRMPGQRPQLVSSVTWRSKFLYEGRLDTVKGLA
ncbi:hypothetical protein BDV37DRAFT_263030, partial [Aspergillus pseudonomiae]